MHAVFYITGVRKHVDEFLHWAETRDLFMSFENPNLNPAVKDNNGNILAKGKQPINMGIRYGLFGTYEAIFSEEEMDKVLTTLRFQETVKEFNHADIITTAKIKLKIAALRKALGLEKIPKFKEDHSIFFPDHLYKFVKIIPIGIRRDKVMQFETGLIHEAL